MAERAMNKTFGMIMAAGPILLSGCGRQSGSNDADDIAVRGLGQRMSQSVQMDIEVDYIYENGESGLKANYGGFEKVCFLETEIPRNDRRTTTHAGDICLYNGDQIVIFYGSNSWAYTRLGKISNTDDSELEKILSGEETEITFSLGASR